MNQTVTNEMLKKLLVEPGHIKEDLFEEISSDAEANSIPLKDFLVERGFIKSEQLGILVAEHLRVPFINLGNEKIDGAVFASIPENTARTRGVIAFKRDDKGIHVGMLNPTDLETLNFITKSLSQKVIPHYITIEDFRKILPRYKEDLKNYFEELLKDFGNPSFAAEERDEITVKIVDALLKYGFYKSASDIHIEPHKGNVLVRFRIDGVVHDALQIPKNLSNPILTRVKVLSKMRIDEHLAAQDGKFSFSVEDQNVDVRVSVVPITKGENVVMRLLAPTDQELSVNNLGLSERDSKIVTGVLKNPHGMVLVSGPTGSGKTTTLYALMKIISKKEVHISSIEDPVEYDIEDISQIQVNPNTNLTFADGLRAIVRQDPDIIMVGEIRDKETASIAANAALTGHLVLSTLHANDAATTPLRLIDMGVEPYLVTSTVNVVIAQRLVRKICTSCRVSHEVEGEEKVMIETDPILKKIIKKYKSSDVLRLYRGNGCDVCGGSGYKGRVGIFEVLELDDEIRALIISQASHEKLMQAASNKGMLSLFEDGVKKAMLGVTTLQEVIRVVGVQDEE